MNQKPFDIRDRTFLFASQIIEFVDNIPDSISGRVLVRQLIRAGTSIGANVEEANSSESRRDFVHKMKIALKEAQETRYWLRLIQTTKLSNSMVEQLIGESDELVRILNTIAYNAKTNKR